MAGLTSLLYTARDALAAQAFGLNVTGQNVSNVATPGYTRRTAILETGTVLGQTTGSVNIAGLRRVADQFMDDRLLDSQSLMSAAEQQDLNLASVEALFNDLGGTGLGNSLDALFGSFSALAANPSDPTTRAEVLARAENFAGAVQRTADTLAERQQEMLLQAQQMTEQANAKTSQISQLNRQISMARNAGQDAADLEDRRSQVLLELGELVDVHTFFDGRGNLVVQGAGTTLVEGDVARTLSIDLAANGTMRLQATLGSGQTTEVTRFLTGGKLAGTFEARDQDITAVFAKLDAFVFETATAINVQHAAGVGLDGLGGRALFSLSPTADGAARAIAVSTDVLGLPDRLAAASGAGSLPGGSDNAVALAQLAQSNITAGGTKTAAQSYADLVGDVALRRANVQRMVETREAIHEQVKTMRESMSGVSLDEELVALTKYQRAYEAATKVLTTADQLLEELMARVG